MKASFYTRIQLRETRADALRVAYLDWALGIRSYGHLGARRRSAGIDPRWNLGELHGGTTLQGDYDARIDTRVDGDRFLLRLLHRDDAEPAVLWHNVAVLREHEDGAILEHGIARTAPPGVVLQDLARPPGLLRDLLKANGARTFPLELGGVPMRIPVEDAEAALDHVILNRDRTFPLVLVTGRAEDDLPVPPDGKEFAAMLLGMARVLVTKDGRAERALNRALIDRGFPRQFATMDGGIRLLFGPLRPEHSPYDNALWTCVRLEDYGDNVANRVAGEIAARIVRRTAPANFFRSIELLDLANTRQRFDQILDALTPADPLLHQLEEQIGPLRAELDRARVQMAELQAENDRWMLEVQAEHDQRLALEQERDALRQQLVGVEADATHLRDALDQRVTEADVPALPDEVRDALGALLVDGAEGLTPYRLLQLVELTWPDRVVVLPKAYESATKRAGFKQMARLQDLLVRLVTAYRDAMRDGGGDAKARHVFATGEFAACESQSTTGNDRARKERTRLYKGEKVVFWKHLKIGIEDNEQSMIRVLFEWDADDEVIVIAHCGEHPFIVSHGM